MDICSLPLEIELLIFDDLRGDRTSLQACSLVCRAWRSTSQIYLFRRLQLKASLSQGEHLAFDQFLSSAPSLAASIRDLHLSGPIGVHADVSSRPPDDRPRVSTQLLRSLISKLPSLQSLSIIFIKFTGGDVEPPIDPLSRPSLENLDINMGGRVGDKQDMINLLSTISLFSHIGQLSISVMAFLSVSPTLIDADHALQSFMLPGPVAVEELDMLSFRTPWISFLYHVLLKTESHVNSLHTICACVTGGWAYIVQFGHFLRAVGPTLRNFKFNPSHTLFYARQGSFPV